MLSIGELAQRTDVSRRMLRHWEDSALLAPARIHPRTGRREYELRQVGRVRAIAALRATGFGLDAIRDLLTSELSEERLIALLRRREAELTQQISEASTRLDEVRSRLASLERGHDIIMKTLDIGPLPSVALVAAQETVADEFEIGEAVSRLLPIIRELAPAEAEIVLAYDGSTDPSVITVTVGIGTTLGAIVGEGLREVLIEGTERGATVRYAESPESVGDAWITIDAELARQGLRTSGPYRQLLHADGGVTLAAQVASDSDCS